MNNDLKKARDATEIVKTEKQALVKSVQLGQNEILQLRSKAKTLGEKIESLNVQMTQDKKSMQERERGLERRQAALVQAAHTKEEALVLFFSELCDCGLDGSRGFVEEIQKDRNIVLRPAQPDLQYWTLLDSWTGDQTVRCDPPSNTSLAALMIDAIRAVASNNHNSWQLQSILRSMMRTGTEYQKTVVHGQAFVVLARLLVQAQPSFEVVLAFWQIMQVVDQRWQPVPGWAEEKSVFEGFLQGHAYSTGYDLVAGGGGEIVGNDECHYFQETAVIRRPGMETAVLTTVGDRCIRFFDKKRWRPSIWECKIESTIDGEAKLKLPIAAKDDLHWCSRFSS